MPTSYADLALALEKDPNGKICAGCQKENTFADDLGFFYKMTDENHYKAHCETCMGPATGDR